MLQNQNKSGFSSTTAIVKEILIAPMLDLTNRHCRYLHRLLSKRVLLYSEMVVTGAILHGDRNRFLDYSSCEHPLALQLAGNQPQELAESAHIAEDWGYDEINFNVGCPSKRVSAGGFGACLIMQPDLVVASVAAMVERVKIPVSVKTRLGIKGETGFQDLLSLIARLEQVGCKKVIIHAREAKLAGMNTRENRRLLPIDYGLVAEVKKEFPSLTVIVNGEISGYEQIEEHLKVVDGVMVGREAYKNPYFLAEIDRRFYGDNVEPKSREQIADEYFAYLKREVANGTRPERLIKPVMGLYKGCNGARVWRKTTASSCRISAQSDQRDQLYR